MINISDELLAAYLDGNTTPDESLMIEGQLATDNSLCEIMDIHNDVLSQSNFIQSMDFGLSGLSDFFWGHQFIENNTMDTPIYEASGLTGNAVNPVQQQYSDTCAIKSQQLILNEYGIDVSEDQLVQYSYDHGWYQGDGSGTQMIDVGNLLEAADIPCTRQADANVFNLVSELSQGHRVIVGVDSGELWGNKFSAWWNDFYHGDTPDHALIVSGIDTSDPENIKVIVTDPGTGEGYKEYPLDQFMDAWSDAQCYMVSTDVPVPEVTPGMENFDYASGHIPTVAGMDYADFQIFNDLSYGLPVCAPTGMSMMNYPVADLYGAYEAVAGGTPFGTIFTGYGFNEYLDTDVTTGMLQQTYASNIDYINFDDVSQPVGPVNNLEYSDFLNSSIDYFNSIGDATSAMLCEQQMMMLNYCDANSLSFYDNFIS